MSDELSKNLKDIQLYYQKSEYLRDTYQQLIKDLGAVFPEEIDEPPNMDDMENLVGFFKPLFGFLLSKRKHQLVQILYRIDLGEAKTASILEGKYGLDVEDILTREILMRELKKVIIRRHYSSHS